LGRTLLNLLRKDYFWKDIKKVWITVCVIIFAIELFITILLLTSTDDTVFQQYVLVDIITQLFIGFTQIAYCIVNTIRLGILINKGKSATKKRRNYLLSRTSMAVITANVGLFLFLIALILEVFNYEYYYNTRYMVYGILYLGHFLSDFGIMFSFKIKRASTSTTTRRTASSYKSTNTSSNN